MTVKRFTEQEKLEENCEPKTMDVEEYCLCSLRWGVCCLGEGWPDWRIKMLQFVRNTNSCVK